MAREVWPACGGQTGGERGRGRTGEGDAALDDFGGALEHVQDALAAR